jgi:hypothetical protein
MILGTIIVGGLLSAAFAGVGFARLAGAAPMRAAARRSGTPFATYRVIGLLEIAGAAGIAGGLWRVAAGDGDAGFAAASCIFLLLVGALATHLRAIEPPAEWPVSARITGLR